MLLVLVSVSLCLVFMNNGVLVCFLSLWICVFIVDDECVMWLVVFVKLLRFMFVMRLCSVVILKLGCVSVVLVFVSGLLLLCGRFCLGILIILFY